VAGEPAPTQRAALTAFLDELERWNHRLNLTTVAPADMWKRHVEESLVMLGTAAPRRGADLVDIGTGAGVPGIVVAVMRPDLRIGLVESLVACVTL